MSQLIFCFNPKFLGGAWIWLKKWDPKLYGKDTFFWLRHKPPNFATFLCAVMWHQNSSKSCRYQMMWWWVTRQNKTQKHNLNTKKQQWKTVLHHHPIWIQKNVTSSKNPHSAKKKRNSFPQLPNSVFDKQNFRQNAWANSSAPRPPWEVGSGIPCALLGDLHLDPWEKHQLHRRILRLGRSVWENDVSGQKKSPEKPQIHRESNET